MFGAKKKFVMCQVCRGLIEASASTCPLCGRESVPPARISTAGLAASGNFFSLVVLTINIALFVLMSVVEVRNGRGADAFLQSASNGVLTDFGALAPWLIRAGQWWRFVTFNFLHIGLMHLMFNSSALFSIGPQVEETFGSQKFAFIYVGTGVASGIASYFFLPSTTAGASGAIFGLIGLMAAYGYRLGGSFGRALMRQMLIWAAIGLVFGFFIRANNVAHVGGFIAGGILGFVLEPEAPGTVRASAFWNATAIACVGVVAISFAMAGKSYGSAQDAEEQAAKKMRRGDDVILLSNRVRSARALVFDQDDLNPTKSRDAKDISKDLKAAAVGIQNAPEIDSRSDQIRNRLVELLNKRANAFEAVGRDGQAFATVAFADLESLSDAFKSYYEWEDSILLEYGLRRGNSHP
ncbi:MAG TPA: rhomboid family intramembrane serine protease [Blastocatellia bacterium]|nr:rhomboid family intramembrane serine protease [Blastocatellia bacterium]